MFAELCSFARTEFPQPSVEQFLSLHQSLKHAVAVADALSSARNAHESASPTDSSDQTMSEKAEAAAEKARCAASWVNAALSSDLGSFSIQRKQDSILAATRTSLKKTTSPQLTVMVDGGPSTVPRGRSASPSLTARPLANPSSPRFRTALSSMSQIGNDRRNGADLRSQSPMKVLYLDMELPDCLEFFHFSLDFVVDSHKKNPLSVQAPALTSSRRSNTVSRTGIGKNAKATSKVTPETPVKETKPLPLPEVVVPPPWVKGKAATQAAQLGQQLEGQAQRWFLTFMEGALDCGFRIPGGGSDSGEEAGGAKVVSQQENCHIASMLSQLKRVNDWLDQVGDPSDTKLVETKTRLKKKIYEFLLQHVESAASALGNVSSIMVYSKPQPVS